VPSTSSPPGPRALGRVPGTIVVFTCSAAVLVIEILAGRMLAPYVGVSLETYTGIVGTVLAGIAAGSALGGALADRRDPRDLIGPAIVAGGLLSVASVPVVRALGPQVANTGGDPTSIVFLAVCAFVLPTGVLSAVSPMIAKLELTTTAQTGTVVGFLSAAGTAGALTGTFVTGFVLVAAMPTPPIVYAVGAALVVLGIVLWAWLTGRRPAPAAVAAVVAAGVVVTGAAAASPSECQWETAYYCVSIERDPQRAGGRTLVLDNLRHSYVDLDDPTHLGFRYVRLFADVVDAQFPRGTRSELNALHLGGGGFTFPRWLAATRPGSTSTVLELDPDLVSIVRDELGLRTGPALRVRVGDARLDIEEEPAGRYDVVIGDAFGGVSVPWHLTTSEMIDEIARVLTPTGAYVANVIDDGPRRFLRAELATLAAEFEHVLLVAPPTGTYGNHIIVGSDAPITAPVVGGDGRVVQGAELDEFVGDARRLRDDFAPVDQLITR
jgi:MFS family permease